MELSRRDAVAALGVLGAGGAAVGFSRFRGGESREDGAERVRYYLVNDLLLALYASPRGGDLVGIENPQGHPGGTETYQRGSP